MSRIDSAQNNAHDNQLSWLPADSTSTNDCDDVHKHCIRSKQPFIQIQHMVVLEASFYADDQQIFCSMLPR